MGIRMVGLCLAMVAWLGSGPAAAQDASILGAVTDETKGALPGVTVTATAIETGRVFTAVSDERGEYRLRGLPPARYKVTAELTGFSTVVVDIGRPRPSKIEDKRWRVVTAGGSGRR